MSDDFAASVYTQWSVWRDLAVELLPNLEPLGLLHLVTELRINHTENGTVGAWAHLPPELDSQREELLYQVLDAYELKTGQPWPLLDDLPPTIPDNASGLTG
jgi:hypothetical protein